METHEFYIREASETEARGPFNLEQLTSLAETGQLSFETLWYDPSVEDWAAIGASDELRNALFPEKRKLRMKMREALPQQRTDSLPPITVEEMLARAGGSDRAFLEQAAQIVVDEIETLERRVRAFSQFASEPPVSPATVDVNSLLEERMAFLKTAHPEVAYDCRLADQAPRVMADQDLIKGILTNLLENAAEAAGQGGRILGMTSAENGHVAIEVHDSGPGLSEQAQASLFQPTISFKKRGMGLGLSIARKSALLSGGDIVLVKGELGGAGFRVLLPATANAHQARPDRG